MKYAYYPGCSLHSTGIEYDISLKAVCKALSIEIEEPKGWICCGSSPAHTINHLLSIALPIKNLSLVEEMGAEEVLVPCAACFSRFKKALYEIEHRPEMMNEVEEVIDSSFQNRVKVVHPLEFFRDNIETVTSRIKKDLSGLKVVCYYGCLLTRPPKVMQFDDPGYPMVMDELMRSVGIETLDWSYKTDCCGASFSLTETDIVLKLSHDILEEARLVGADGIVTACQLCQANLDMRQQEIEDKYKAKYDLPIFFFTQLMGLALGIEEKKLALNRHLVPVAGVLGERIRSS